MSLQGWTAPSNATHSARPLRWMAVWLEECGGKRGKAEGEKEGVVQMYKKQGCGAQ